MRPTGPAVGDHPSGAGYDAREILERKAFLEFDQQDGERLQRVHERLEPFGTEFATAFYDHLLSFPALRQMLPDAQSLARLKRAQTDYFSRLTAGDYEHDYVINRLRIGQVHHRFGLEPKWYIGAYRKYLSGLMPLVWAQCDGDIEGFLAIYDSLLKVVLFDMGLALESYFQADRQALQEMKDYADRVIRTMPSGLLVLDGALRLRTINLAAREMLGLEEGALVTGRELGQLLNSPTLLGLAREVLDKEQSSRALLLGPLPDLGGRILAVTLSATLIDEAPALLLQCQDETEGVQAEESLARFRTALDASQDAIFLIDRANMRFVDMNATACAGLGYTRQELLELGPPDIKPLLGHEELARQFDEVLAAPDRAGRIETLHRRKDGSTFPVEVVLRAFRSEGRSMLVAVARDSSARMQTEASLHLARRALESSSNGIIITDCQQPDNPIVYVNPGFERITGYSAAEAMGRNCRFLCAEDQHQMGTTVLRESIDEQGEVRVTLRNYRKDGSLFWNQLYVAPVRNEAGVVTHFVGVQNDISEQKQAEENLLHMATHDALTHLPNRSLLQDRIEQAIGYADRMQHDVGVLFIDIDRFKTINDSLGHAAGDQLIVTLGQRLRDAVRGVDTVARVGGDEFVIILTDVSRETDIAQVLPNLFAAITQPVPVDGHSLTVTASIGISVYPRDGRDQASLLKNADTAMYRAKEAGRNGFRFYAQDMNADAVDRLHMENDLRQAIAADELVVHYQPQVDTETGGIVAAEALLRWQHPQRGLIPPGDFIPLAEETGLIVPIGEWVLRRVCAQVSHWRALGLAPIKVAVNLSPRQFRQHDVVTMISRALADHDLPSDWLELEITEGSLMHNPEEAAVLLEELSQLGFRLAVDDFGTGYSSLAYLKRFPLHALKIDKSFVSDIESNRDSAAIATAVIALAHSLGLKVVAEGVEQAAQMDYLRGLNCDFAQGYLLGRPMPPDEFVAAMRRQACPSAPAWATAGNADVGTYRSPG